MYSLENYAHKITIIFIISGTLLTLIVLYAVYRLIKHRPIKLDSIDICVMLIILTLIVAFNFKNSLSIVTHILDYPNARALEFEVVKGLHQEKDVIRESFWHEFFRTMPDESGFIRDKPAIIVRDKINGVWLNSSISDRQFGFDGTQLHDARYRVYYLKYSRIIVKQEKIN
jgi:hypothetical protein